MPTLTGIPSHDYEKLLGPHLKNASPCPGTLPANPNKRTLFIGLGGSGVKTIDQLKVLCRQRLAPGWENHIGFLGIDSYFSIPLQPAHLDKEKETILFPLIPPSSWKYSTYSINDFLSDFRCPPRSFLKHRLHDNKEEGTAVDVQIAEKTCHVLNTLFPPPQNGQPPFHCDVYIIAGSSGATGSGCFTELPALVKKAFGRISTQIHGVLYLPDNFVGLAPWASSHFMANGYALLKELNYYQGVSMRPGYSDAFIHSNPAHPEITLDNFLDVPYLVSAIPGDGARSLDHTIYHTAELLLTKVLPLVPIPMPAHLPKATDPANPNREAVGWAHEFPSDFAAFGMAKAAVPRDTIRAYQISRLLKESGLDYAEPISLMDAHAGTNQAESLLLPLTHFLQAVTSRRGFDFVQVLNLDPNDITVKNIQAGMFDTTEVRGKIHQFVQRSTSTDQAGQIREDVRRLFREFRAAAEQYVKEYGPLAFVNLFRGNFQPVDGYPGKGLNHLIQNLSDCRRFDGKPILVRDLHDCESELRRQRQELEQIPPLRLMLLSRLNREAAAEWVSCVEAVVNEHINGFHRDLLFGSKGLLAEEFLKPANALVQEIQCFGEVLSAMHSIYRYQGEPIVSWAAFREASDFPSGINAAGDEHIYDSLARELDIHLDQVNPCLFREHLVDAFFSEPEQWLDVEQRLVRQTNSWELISESCPIAARLRFDRLVDQVTNLVPDLSLSNLYTLAPPAIPFFHALVDKLNFHCQLRFDGTPNPDGIQKKLYYPAFLSGHPAIVQALRDRAAHWGIPVWFVLPWEEDAFAMIQEATGLELYRLRSLSQWEQEYAIRCSTGNTLYGYPWDIHGNAPDKNGLSWKDYPTIVYHRNWENRDPYTGDIPPEGRSRLRIRDEVLKALELGVLYSEQTPQGWVVKRVHLDDRRDWRFDLLTAMEFGTLKAPTGRYLAEEVAQQNGVTLQSISRVVCLENAGLFSRPAATEEYAWEYACRVLRAHPPMMREIRSTMERFEEWDNQCRTCNEENQEKARPAAIFELIRKGIFTRDNRGVWIWYKEDGTREILANFSDPGVMLLPEDTRIHLENGLTFYELWKKVNEALPGIRLFEEAERPVPPDALSRKNQLLLEEFREECLAHLENGMSADPDCDKLDFHFRASLYDVEEDPETLLEIQRIYALAWSQLQ